MTTRQSVYQSLFFLAVVTCVRMGLLSIEFPESDEVEVSEDKPRPQLALHGSYWNNDND
jgi:hypothetical protein